MFIKRRLRKTILLLMIIIVFFTLAGCNKKDKFNDEAEFIALDLENYVVYNSKFLRINQDQFLISKLIQAQLKEENVKVRNGSHHLESFVVKDNMLHFIYKYYDVRKMNSFSLKYAFGVLNLENFSVTIRTHKEIKDDFYTGRFSNIVSDDFAFMTDNNTVFYVNLTTYETLWSQNMTEAVATYLENTKAIITDKLYLYTFEEEYIEETVYEIDISKKFSYLFYPYLVSYTTSTVLHLETLELAPYYEITTMIEEQNNQAPTIFFDASTEELVIEVTHISKENLMGLTSTLQTFLDLTVLHGFTFNHYSVVESDSRSYLVLQYFGSGLMLLHDDTQYFVFLIEEENLYYIGMSYYLPFGVYQRTT